MSSILNYRSGENDIECREVYFPYTPSDTCFILKAGNDEYLKLSHAVGKRE